MKHVLWTWAMIAVACGPASNPPATPSSPRAAPGRIERIERGLLPAVQVKGEDIRYTLQDRMREHKIPAIGIAVFEGYKLQWAKTYGMAEVETGTRADEDTTFLAGSISKSVHALAVLMAAADGTLALDKPINDQLEGWKLPDNELTRATPVTLRMLLSHTAGTTVHGFPGYAAGEPIPTVQQILDGKPPANTPAVRVDLAPGTMFRYSGGGTVISQLALTERSKRPYPDVLAERVLGPLAMVHSSYEQTLSPERLRHAATGYDRTGAPIAGKWHAYPEMAAAGLWTTPADLARFFAEIALARAGKSSHVATAIALQMTTKVIDIEGSDAVGLGVFLEERNGARLFGHDGDDAGFQAEARASLDGGYGVVMMASSNNGFRIFDEVARAVFAEYGWPGADPVVVRIALAPGARARFVGQYLVGVRPFAITEQGGQLALRTPFKKPVELVAIAPDHLVQRDTGRQLHLDANGSLDVTSPQEPSRKATRLAASARNHLFEIEAGRLDDAVAAWRDRIQTAPKTALEEEIDANGLGYLLMAEEPARAVDLLRLVAIVFPESSNAHDSLGEAYMKVGDWPRAIAEYEQAIRTLDADPRVPPDGRPARRHHAEAQIAKLRTP